MQNNYYKNGNLSSKYLCKYDEKRRLIEECCYYRDTILDWIKTYKYNSEGNLLEDTHKRNDDEHYENSKTKYDPFGNPVEYIGYDSNQNIKSKTSYVYEYDNRNNWIKKSVVLRKGIQDILERKIEQ